MRRAWYAAACWRHIWRISVEIEIGIAKSGRRAWGFDDIAIVPSRRTRDPEDVKLNWEIDAFTFDLPMMAAAMDSAVSPRTAIEIGRLGGLAGRRHFRIVAFDGRRGHHHVGVLEPTIGARVHQLDQLVDRPVHLLDRGVERHGPEANAVGRAEVGDDAAVDERHLGLGHGGCAHARAAVAADALLASRKSQPAVKPSAGVRQR